MDMQPDRSKPQIAAEDTDQANDDQIDCHNKIQQARHGQNENAGDQRNEGSKAEGDIHWGTFSFQFFFASAASATMRTLPTIRVK
jgi:hypothetical protein